MSVQPRPAGSGAGPVALPVSLTRVLLSEWAAARGVPLPTAWRWAAQGLLDGRDADHPHAEYDAAQRRWWVFPLAYRHEVVLPPTADDLPEADLERLADRVAAKLAQRLTGGIA